MRLDLGCGSGRSYPFSPSVAGPDVVYVDLEAPPGPPGGLSFVVADAHQLPFRDGVFREVHMRHVLEHLEEPRRALREVLRVLKPGGELSLEVPAPFSKVFELDPDHRWRLSPRALRGLLRGFSEVEIWAEGISPRLVPIGPLRLLLARWLPKIPWPLGEYLACRCVK